MQSYEGACPLKTKLCKRSATSDLNPQRASQSISKAVKDFAIEKSVMEWLEFMLKNRTVTNNLRHEEELPDSADYWSLV